MAKRKTDNTATPEPQQANNGVTEDNKHSKYVVVREGYRVSDREYETPTDPFCVSEIEFWTKVANNHSYGEKVEPVIYDSKKHRVW